jgi:beta-mannosidase
VTPLVDGWQASCDGGAWLPARVPGTAAAVLADAGLPTGDLDAQEWRFRRAVDVPEPESNEELVLRLDGIATVADVLLDGRLLLTSTSMFERHLVRLEHGGELEIRCRPLAPLLAERRTPRARWRSALADNNLRWHRTMLLGRAPGIAPGPPPVGPWRPVSLERRRDLALDELRVRTRGDGGVHVRVAVRALGGVTPDELVLEVADATAEIRLRDGRGEVQLVVSSPELWWPHTHGEPALHDLRLHTRDGVELATRRVGFRDVAWASDVERDGLALRVNGVDLFVRGAVWTPVDPVALAASTADVRATLEMLRDAGMNMVRIPGTSCYESDDFHDLCDELGLLVWQDFMFANLDYPIGDDAFRRTVEGEARDVLERLAPRPSLAVLCGNSEVEQQVAMLGLDPALGRGELFGKLLPALVAESDARVVYVPSAPCGGALPFRTDRGVANYFGVGGYRRPLSDARLADVRFASECLAFANVPDDDVDDRAGVPRDAGADWDFQDVRDHYLETVFAVDHRALDRPRYLELSREVSGHVMAEVFGEWRRDGSPCRGGLVLWSRDLVDGAGWGLLARDGRPKVALRHLARVLAPVAVWTTDEGLNGVAVHVANDRPEPLVAELRVALYARWEHRVGEAVVPVSLPPAAGASYDVETLLGRFVDASWAYKFGAPQHDAIVATLMRGGIALSQAVRFPAGPPLEQEAAAAVGLAASLDDDGTLHVRSRRLAWGVRIDGADAADDAFTVEPGSVRLVAIRAGTPVAVRALNVNDAVPVARP